MPQRALACEILEEQVKSLKQQLEEVAEYSTPCKNCGMISEKGMEGLNKLAPKFRLQLQQLESAIGVLSGNESK